jgi:preprotein translocase subunit SecG
MGILLTAVHIIVCIILIMVVLLQSGKAADLAGAFGGGGSQTALGSRGAATLLTKATTTAAVLFMLTSLGLAILASREGRSVLEDTPVAPTAVQEPAAVDDQLLEETLPIPVEGEGAAMDQLDEGTTGTE